MTLQLFAGLGHVHFVGIGGAGMSGIAEVLLQYDLAISGCDLAASEATERLQRLGVRIDLGHDPAHLDGVDLVVVSSAVSPDSPELAAARERGITVVRRAEMLAELMRLKYGVAVAGTHGKTTTTSLVGTLLTEAGLDPTVIVGGRLRVSGTGARLGASDLMVVEADEFDRSFLALAPVVAVVTSVDRDHLDTYRDLDEIRDAFVAFASRVPFFGQVIACRDDPGVVTLLPRLAGRRLLTYGLAPEAELRAERIAALATGSRFTVVRGGRELGEFDLPMPGQHNVRNALAAVGVGLVLGLAPEQMARSLAGFAGVHRRFEHLGSYRGADVIDDYAHHPAEVAATLAAARQVFPRRRLWAVFQPHLFSRTRDLADEFGRVLVAADRVIVTEVYPSREAPLPGVSGELVVAAARAAGHGGVAWCPRWPDVVPLLAAEVEPGDVVITLGAGDIVRLAERLVGEGPA